MTVSQGNFNRYQQLTSVRLVSTSNVAGVYSNGLSNNGVGATLTSASTGALTIDSVAAVQGDRVLLQNQTNNWENGIYEVLAAGSTVAVWQLQRSDDMQIAANIKTGMFIPVEAGTLDAGTIFVVVEPLPAVLGVNALAIESSPTNSGLGTAATKEASDNTKGVVASVIDSGSLSIGDLLIAGDVAGSVQDSGVSADDLMLMPAPSVTGNFPKASDNLGTMVDSGISPSDAAKTKAVMAGSAVQVGYLPHFIDTAGTIDDTAGNVINAGNIQAGLSGTAGTLGSFPSAGTSGELLVAAVTNSSGNFNTTISNASAVGQAQVISIPDSGASTANFILSKNAGTQTISSGNLSVAAGNLSAGSSGAAGTVSSFPSAASKGSLKLVGVANTNDDAVTISNALHGQATVYSIPDVGASTGQILVKTAALVSGNLVQASGTAGKVVDSGAPASGLLQVASVALSAAEFNGMYAAPKLLIAAPGTNNLIVVDRAYLVMTFVSANYAAGGIVGFQYDSTAHGIGVLASNTEAAADFFAAASTTFAFTGNSGNTVGLMPFTTSVNKGLYLSNQTQAFTTGDSTWVAKIFYRIVAVV